MFDKEDVERNFRGKIIEEVCTYIALHTKVIGEKIHSILKLDY